MPETEGEVKKCPRCGNRFLCKNHDIFNCFCIMIPLNALARQLISEKYDDCLCEACLNEYVAKTEGAHEK